MEPTMYNLRKTLIQQLPSGTVKLCHCGIISVPVEFEEAFRTELEIFVESCNFNRKTAEGYELCQDPSEDGATHTFYVMREDGEAALTFTVRFTDEPMGCAYACN